jgi:hypothetical protein
MAANSVPRFLLPENSIGSVDISTANTNRDGTGTVGTVWTAGAGGGQIELIRVIAKGTTTAGMIRLFLHDGAAYHFYDELVVAAVTPSGTVAAFEGEIVPSKPLVLPSGWSLRASTHNAEAFSVVATGGNY